MKFNKAGIFAAAVILTCGFSFQANAAKYGSASATWTTADTVAAPEPIKAPAPAPVPVKNDDTGKAGNTASGDAGPGNAGGRANSNGKSAIDSLTSGGTKVSLPEPVAEKVPQQDGDAAADVPVTREESDFYGQQDQEPAAIDADFGAANPPDTGPIGEEVGGPQQPAGPAAPSGGLGGDGKIKLHHNWTGETLDLQYRGENGSYAPGAAEKIKHFMRCRLTGREMDIPLKLIEVLDILQERSGNQTITVLSGYRSPQLNGSLKGAAKNSLHMRGWAADITIAGVSPPTVRARAAAMKAGGVGSYPTFTHVDVGSVRYW